MRNYKNINNILICLFNLYFEIGEVVEENKNICNFGARGSEEIFYVTKAERVWRRTDDGYKSWYQNSR